MGITPGALYDALYFSAIRETSAFVFINFTELDIEHQNVIDIKLLTAKL